MVCGSDEEQKGASAVFKPLSTTYYRFLPSLGRSQVRFFALSLSRASKRISQAIPSYRFEGVSRVQWRLGAEEEQEEEEEVKRSWRKSRAGNMVQKKDRQRREGVKGQTNK